MSERSDIESYVDREEQRRAFWSIYLLDRLFCCARDRPPAILDTSCRLQLPMREESWTQEKHEHTLDFEQLSDAQQVTVTSLSPFAGVVVMASTLGQAAQYMLQDTNLRARVSPWDANSEFTAIESKLLQLERQIGIQEPLTETVDRYQSLAGEMDHSSLEAVIFSRALFHFCYCILNHPFLLRRRLRLSSCITPTSFLRRAFDLAWIHAQSMSQLISQARALGCNAHASFYGYSLVVSSTIIGMKQHSNDEIIRAQAEEMLHGNLSVLRDIGFYWVNISSIVCIIDYLHRLVRELSSRYTDFYEQTTAVQKFLEISYRFSGLIGDTADIEFLSSADEERMWSLVDYNTMSAGGNAVPDTTPCSPFWMDQISWHNLFQGTGSLTLMDLFRN